MKSAAESLLGKTIQGWDVIEKVDFGHDLLGGNFSVSYKVKKDGKLAF